MFRAVWRNRIQRLSTARFSGNLRRIFDIPNCVGLNVNPLAKQQNPTEAQYKTGMLLYARRAIPKPRKRRSMFGCVYCKQKRKKCDENRPQCTRCAEHGQQCRYELVESHRSKPAPVNASVSIYDSNSPVSECYLNSSKCWYDSDTPQDSPDSFSEWKNTSRYEISHLNALPEEWKCLNQDLGITFQLPILSPLLSSDGAFFSEFTGHDHRQGLMDHFSKVLSNLIIFNPFRQLTLPLAHASSPILDALLAFSSSYLEHRGLEDEETSLYFHNKALHGLTNLLDPMKEANRETVLGTIMLLLYYEVLVGQSKRNIVNGHLKAATMIMRSIPKPSTPPSIFLDRALCFYDIIVALSFDQAPYSPTAPTEEPVSFKDRFETSNQPLSNVDSLLGFLTTLLPILHRLACLRPIRASMEEASAAGNSSKTAVLRSEFESTSQGIKLALISWSYTVPKDRINDTLQDGNTDNVPYGARSQSFIKNTDAYRHSALVYLYREVYFHPRISPSIQKHTHLSLMACKNSIESAPQCYDGAALALLWPAFMAGCEAITGEDRDIASMVFMAIDERQGMRNAADAWEILREVWRRVDLVMLEGGDEVHWRDICQEKGLDIVFA